MKIFITGSLIVLAGIGSYLWLNNNKSGLAEEALTTYFNERMVTLGINEGYGQPIEGFDAGLLMGSFPGLIMQDFQDVETMEGHYEVVGGELSFVRDVTEPISTAERTVSEAGYKTLLNNLSSRLGIVPDSEIRINQIIDTINTADIVSAKLNQTASVFGVSIVPIDVIEDSRCPEDVTCIQAGTVKVATVITSGRGVSINKTLELNQEATTTSEKIILIRVDPQTSSTRTLPDAEYTFYFEVRK